jgi:hypothetical protein
VGRCGIAITYTNTERAVVLAGFLHEEAVLAAVLARAQAQLAEQNRETRR